MKYAKDFIVSITGAIVRVAILIIAIIFIMSFAKTAYDFGYRVFTEQPMSPSPGRDVTVTVSEGQGDTDIAKMIEEKGLCRDYRLFVIQKKLSAHKDAIKPGSYTLNTSMSTDEMFAALAGEKVETDEIMTVSDEYAEELNPETDDLTGLETGGVLADDETYSEGEAFDEATEYEGEETEGEGANEEGTEDVGGE